MMSVGLHTSRTSTLHIPDFVVSGDKFLQWDDDSSTASPVTLRIDPKGYILYWKYQNKEIDYLDMSLIRDTRTGKYARLPKDSRLLHEVMKIVAQDCALEDKILTVCYGCDMVSVSFVNFAAIGRNVAKEWSDLVFSCALSVQSYSASPLTLLHKLHTVLTVVTENEGKTSVRSIIKMFTQSKEERKKVEQALESMCYPCSKGDFISQFTFDDFLIFYHKLCGRHEVHTVFKHLGNGSYMTAEQFMWFLNEQQRDPRLNEILHPFCDAAKAQSLITKFEPDDRLAEAGHLSEAGLLHYLLSEENSVMPREKLEVTDDMTQPLSHYFINSSHNTYLTGHQFTGKSSAEIYRQVLLSGCRCVELDCWDGKAADDEPIITHGFTVCTEVPCKEVLEAIAETAFKASEFPLILSFENHCSPKQQAKLARYCRTIFGEMLLTDPLDSHPLDVNVALPSPDLLKRKIIVKNKKKSAQTADADTDRKSDLEQKSSTEPDNPRRPQPVPVDSTSISSFTASTTDTSSAAATETSASALAGIFDDFDWDLDPSESLQCLSEEDLKKRHSVMIEKGTAGQEVEAVSDLSALVNYIEPIRFHSFEHADKRDRSYESTSFVETQATLLLKTFPVDFVHFNKRQLSRVYPKGTRVDSSNYLPQIFWNAGCQMVALNFQTLDLGMQLNLGRFEYNGRCGYLLKPEFMRRRDRQFDPFTESTVDGIVAATVQVKVISGQFISDRKCGSYVEIDMFGLPADTVRRKFRTKVVQNNAINPVYDEEAFVFHRVILPTLASLRVAVYNDNGTSLLGHRILPVDTLRPGYRHIGLRSEFNQPQGVATLFVHIQVKDYIIDAFAEIAQALYNPIAYQSQLEQLERRTRQLSVFDDVDEPQQLTSNSEAAETARLMASHLMQSRSGSLVPSKSPATTSVKMSLTQQFTAAVRSTSVPSSPLRNSSLLSVDTADSVSKKTMRLQDASVMTEMSMTDLMEMKSYTKLIAKQSKQLELLRQKHDKMQRSKMALSLKPSSHANSRKTAGRSSPLLKSKNLFTRYVDILNVDSSQSPQASASTAASASTSASASRDSDELTSLCRQHYREETDVQLSHQSSLSVVLERLAASHRDNVMAALDNIHDRQVDQLRRNMDSGNKTEMKLLAAKYSNKHELARVRRDVWQQFINEAVQQRQHLKDVLEQRKAELTASYERLIQQISATRKEEEESLERLYQTRCSGITNPTTLTAAATTNANTTTTDTTTTTTTTDDLSLAVATSAHVATDDVQFEITHL